MTGEFPYVNLVAPEGSDLTETDIRPPGTHGQVDLRVWTPPPLITEGGADGGGGAPLLEEHALQVRSTSEVPSSDFLPEDDPLQRLPHVALSVQRLSPAIIECRDHLGNPTPDVEIEIFAEDIPYLPGHRAKGVLWRGATAQDGNTPQAWLPTGAKVIARVVGAPERFVPAEVGRADGFAQEAQWVVTETEKALTQRITVPCKPYLDIRAYDLATGEGIMGLRVQARR